MIGLFPKPAFVMSSRLFNVLSTALHRIDKSNQKLNTHLTFKWHAIRGIVRKFRFIGARILIRRCAVRTYRSRF